MGCLVSDYLTNEFKEGMLQQIRVQESFRTRVGQSQEGLNSNLSRPKIKIM